MSDAMGQEVRQVNCMKPKTREVMQVNIDKGVCPFGVEKSLNEFLKTVDPVSIQMSVTPDGETQIMVVHRKLINEEKDEPNCTSGEGNKEDQRTPTECSGRSGKCEEKA